MKNQIVQLIKSTATALPVDVIEALQKARAAETDRSARGILAKILDNIDLAKQEIKPICQDTGLPIFYVEHSVDYTQAWLTDLISQALSEATASTPLRPNTVEALTNKNLGNQPIIHFAPVAGTKKLQVVLILKGGGSENVSAIYQLPNPELNANRDLAGVRKCLLDAVFKAQGRGCPPYIIGAAMGGSLEEVAFNSKKQLLRKLTDTNPTVALAKFEQKVLVEINQLGIGPLGLGGQTTALALKISSGNRHPASFFVGFSFCCWCLRRQSLCLD